MKRSAAVAVALSAAVSLAACGSTTSTAPSTSPSTSSTSAPPLTGGKTITAPKSHVTVQVPSSWQLVDSSTLQDANVADVAKRLNTTVEGLRSMVAQVDVMAIDPAGTFHANVNVVLTPMTELPTEAQIRAQFTQFNAEVSSVTTESTPLGQAIVSSYRLSTLNANGKGLFVKTSTGVVNVTFTAQDAGTAATLYDEMVPTLAVAN